MDEDKVIKEIIELRADVDEIKETMVTKKEMNRVYDTLDVLVKLAKKKDQELTAVTHQQKLMNNDIARIKPLVGLA